jgi:transposase
MAMIKRFHIQPTKTTLYGNKPYLAISGYDDPFYRELVYLRTEIRELNRQLSESNQQANYWKYHADRRAEQIKQLEQENRELQAKLNLRERQLFGRKSETSNSQQQPTSNTTVSVKKKRGRSKGCKGHGRRKHDCLPVIDDLKEIPLDDRLCNKCGLPYDPFGDTEDSEVLEIEVNAHKRKVRRTKYKRSCACPDQPGIITAPPEPKLIPKGKLGISIWVELLLDKFMGMNPTNRLLAQWQLIGLDIPLSTVTNGLKRIEPMLQPVYEAIVEHNRTQQRWHADETRWQVFTDVAGKTGYRWYMWVFAAQTCVVYVLDQSRSAKVPQVHFGIVAAGILNVDRFSSYKALAKTNSRIVLAFCWAHVRRDFIAVAKDWNDQEEWAMRWVEDIGQLYHLNKKRLLVKDQPKQWNKHQIKLENAINQMANQRDQQLAQDNLHPARKKALNSLKQHWAGLTVFVDHPEIPMDNNEAERLERKPVVGRKNFYGSHAIWSGQLMAMMLTITQTLFRWKINPKIWLTEFLTACAQNNGQTPENVLAFLPWNMKINQSQQSTMPTARLPGNT